MVEPWMALLLAAASSFVGLGWLALAMTVHWQQVMQTRDGPSRSLRRALRAGGVAVLLVSAACCFVADHPSMAVLVWIMLLAVAAPVIGLLLAWRPRLLRRLILLR